MPPKKTRGRSMQEVIQTESQSEGHNNPQSITDGSSGQSSSSTRRGRGPARPISSWGTGEKLHLTFNLHNQPIGLNKAKFMSQLGIIARNGRKAPLTYVEWRDVPDYILDAIWNEVQENTDAPDLYKENCLRSVGEIWKNHKCMLKREYFHLYEVGDEGLPNAPPRVQEEQWPMLMEYWRSEKSKNMAATNKANREKQGFPHRIGRKGLSDIRHEMEEEGDSTDRMSVWLRSRKPKPDVRQDPDTEEVISQFSERLAQFPEVEQTSEVREEIFREVLGSDGHGRVRTYGRGPSYTDVFSKSSKTPVEERMEKMTEELAATKKQVEMQQVMFDGIRAYFESQGIQMPFFNEQVPDVGSSHRPHPQSSSHHGSPSHD